MPTLVRVREWGNSLALRLPKSFASQRAITDGTTVQIDSLKIVDTTPSERRRRRYKLKDLLKDYTTPPKSVALLPRARS